MTATSGIANGVAHDELHRLEAEEEQTLPPHSTQAEEAVLGSVLKHGLSIADVLPFLKPHHFYGARHRHIYAAMAALFERGAVIDYHTIVEELERLGVDGLRDVLDGATVLEALAARGLDAYRARPLASSERAGCE